MAFTIKRLPRWAAPFRFTRSYSERCVSRCVFGNESELIFLCIANVLPQAELDQNAVGNSLSIAPVQKKSSTEIGGRLLKQKNRLIERAIGQVFPPRQRAIQWWQLELRLLRDSCPSPQVAGWWELDLSQE